MDQVVDGALRLLAAACLLGVVALGAYAVWDARR